MTFGRTADEVRAMMGCSEEEFAAIRGGAIEPRWVILDRLVMFIVSEQDAAIRRNRELLAEIRRKMGRRSDE